MQDPARWLSGLVRLLRLVGVCAVACAGSAHADVVTFTRLGTVMVAVPGNPFGVAVGDPVRLDVTFEREFLVGQTPLAPRLPPPPPDGREGIFPPSVQSGGFEIRLSIGALLFRESDDERPTSFSPRLSLGADGRPVIDDFEPIAVLGGIPVRGMGFPPSPRFTFFDVTDGERELVTVLFDRVIDPPPVATPPLRQGAIQLLADNRRLEQIACGDIDLIRTFTPPPVFRPIVPFADLSRGFGECFSSGQQSTVSATRMQGSGDASTQSNGSGGVLSASASRYQVSFALDAAQPFSFTGRLTKSCTDIFGIGPNDLTLAGLVTPFAVLRRADGSEVQRIGVRDVTTPDQIPDPNVPDNFPTDVMVGGNFARSGQLDPGQYELELVADSGRNGGCARVPADTWAFELRIGAGGPPPPPPPLDGDGDGVPDAMDNCPRFANAGQEDAGGLAAAPPDGNGDACQCGDVTRDGRVALGDAILLLSSRIPRVAQRLPQGTCDVDGNGRCEPADGVEILRALAGNPSALAEQRCRNARGAQP